MKLTQKQILMALFAVTFIASGCASTGGGSNNSDSSTSTTNPIQVTKFNAFPNPAPSGNTVTFTLELKNTGSVAATDVVGRLWNPPFANTSEDTRTWRDEDGGAIISDGEGPERRFMFGKLRGTKEGVETFAQPQTLRLTAPDLSDGQNFPYNFHAKYFYKYSTEGSTTITAMGNQQYRDSDSSKSRLVEISHNSAPVTLKGQLLSGNPIVFYNSDREQGYKDVEFCVVINNEGGGTVLDRSAQIESGSYQEYNVEENKNKVNLSVEVLGTTQVKYEDEEQTDGDGSFQTKVDTIAELVGGDQKRKCFTMRVQSLSSSAQTSIGPINVKAKYAYAEDTSTTVTVNGR